MGTQNKITVGNVLLVLLRCS